MSCSEVQRELVAFHFGVVSDATRQEVEEHLPGCTHCLRELLSIKRDIETAESGPRPSESARERLRLAVARELGVAQPRRRWSWWERPLAFGLAGVAVMLAMIVVGALASGAGSMPYAWPEESLRVERAPALLSAPRGPVPSAR